MEPEVEHSVVWTPDLVDNEGDKDCEHDWIVGMEFVETDSDGKALTERILPRICSECERKEFLFEHTTTTEKKDKHPYIELNKSVTEKIKTRPVG
jgi:hypothetical protein